MKKPQATNPGYVVCDTGMTPLYQGRFGVLWVSPTKVSLYATRAMAQAAIRVTNQYAIEHGCDWDDNYSVLRAIQVFRTLKRRPVSEEPRR